MIDSIIAAIKGKMKGNIHFSNSPSDQKRRLMADYDAVVRYLKSEHGIETYTEYDAFNVYDPNNGTITISSRLSLRNRLYTLLHEAGHVLARQDVASYQRRYSCSVPLNKRNSDNVNIRARIDNVREEIDAWNLGLDLANRLSIDIDVHRYYECCRRFVYSYIDYCMNPKKHRYSPLR